MCGIIGYFGSESKAKEVILEGLKNLEYRGYDSWGISIFSDKISTIKGKGKISEISSLDIPDGSVGIGHSRWATHGMVTKENAHPHTDCSSSIHVVHNGIVENFSELKNELSGKGHVFKTETDTEVIAHLIEEHMKESPLHEAVRLALKTIEGRNAIVVLAEREMIGARKGSPLIVGVSDGEYFIASDIPAFLKYTRNVMYMDDNEMVHIKEIPKFCKISSGETIQKRLIEIAWDQKQAEKSGYEHFMIKEIMEQKETIRRSINQNDEEIIKIAREINNSFGTFFIGCGTAGKACMAAEYFFSKIARKHVNFITASEFHHYESFITDNTLLVAISQSGETADVMEALEQAKKKNAKIISIVNVVGSSIDRISDHTFAINAGPEKAVASTKATTAQMALAMLLAYASVGKLTEGKRVLVDAAGKVNDMLNPRYESYIKTVAEKIKDSPNIFIIGRGLNYPIALESAIKIMEVSYIHAQGFAGGELKHGPIALIDKGTPCIVLVAEDETKKSVLGNAMEVKSRGGYIIGVSPENNEIFDYWIAVPDVGMASPIINVIPMQLLAYHLGVLRNTDIDHPKNLAKSVTVK